MGLVRFVGTRQKARSKDWYRVVALSVARFCTDNTAGFPENIALNAIGQCFQQRDFLLIQAGHYIPDAVLVHHAGCAVFVGVGVVIGHVVVGVICIERKAVLLDSLQVFLPFFQRFQVFFALFQKCFGGGDSIGEFHFLKIIFRQWEAKACQRKPDV